MAVDKRRNSSEQIIYHKGRELIIRPMSKKEYKNWGRMHHCDVRLSRLQECLSDEEKDSWKQVSEQPQRNNQSNQRLSQM